MLRPSCNYYLLKQLIRTLIYKHKIHSKSQTREIESGKEGENEMEKNSTLTVHYKYPIDPRN